MKTTLAVAVSLALVACASSNENKRAEVGAGGGAATGAVVGGALGGWKGAAVGAVTGALAGGAAGHLLDKQAQELKARDLRATRTVDGILVQLKDDLLFDTDSDVIKPEAVDQLAQLGDVLAKYPDDHIQVVGFTDASGRLAHNEELSQRRAEAVRKVLVERGVSEKQALALGMGPKQPIASNTTPSGRAKNRRVEVRIALAK